MLWLTKIKAKEKACPFTLNIPSAKSQPLEYRCLGEECMAWEYDDSHIGGYEKKGTCRLIYKGE